MARIDIRLEPEAKAKLEQLAKTHNQTITTYVLDKAVFELLEKLQQEEINQVLLEQVCQKNKQIEEKDR